MSSQQTAEIPKAIETLYNGYRFRSRLEARWAVFFDALKIRYEYEKEGFDLGGGLRYLPDFWLPELQCWIEIKPTWRDREAFVAATRKALALAQSTGHDLYVFSGDCALPIIGLENFDNAAICCHRDEGGPRILRASHTSVNCYCWGECLRCQKIGISWRGRLIAVGCVCPEVSVLEGWSSPRIQAAFAISRAVRFDAPEVRARLTPETVRLAAATAYTEGLNSLLASEQACLHFQRCAREQLSIELAGEED